MAIDRSTLVAGGVIALGVAAIAAGQLLPDDSYDVVGSAMCASSATAPSIVRVRTVEQRGERETQLVVVPSPFDDDESIEPSVVVASDAVRVVLLDSATVEVYAPAGAQVVKSAAVLALGEGRVLRVVHRQLAAGADIDARPRVASCTLSPAMTQANERERVRRTREAGVRADSVAVAGTEAAGVGADTAAVTVRADSAR